MNLFGGTKGTLSLKELSESDRVRFFIEDILAPIVAADGIDDVESKALNSAWLLYGIESSYRKDKFRKSIDDALRTRTNTPCTKTIDDIREVFRRICTTTDQTTYNEFVTLIDWCNERARRAGGALFSCRETSSWAETHFRAKVDAIRADKVRSVDRKADLSDSTVAPSVDPNGEAMGHATSRVVNTAETGKPNAPDLQTKGTSANVERDGGTSTPAPTTATPSSSDAPNNVPLAKPIDPPTVVKAEEEKPLAPPHVVDANLSPDFWCQLQGRVLRILQELPGCATQVLDELGPIDRAQDKMCFRESRGDRVLRVFTVSESEAPRGSATWIIGDVHGDLLAFESALQYVDSQGDDARIVFLGDLFDRGIHSTQVVLRFLQELARRPKRICLVAGNHDVGMSVDTATRPYAFRSRIDPSDFVESLNAHRHQHALDNEIGRTICDLSHGAPRAIFFEDGLFLAHGGIPQADMWEDMKVIEAMNTAPCLADFTFRRTRQSVRGRGVNRNTEYSEFGFKDYCRFCRMAERVLGFLPERMIRGHDHVDANARFEVFERWGNRVVTISNMCYSQPGEDVPRRALQLDYVRQPAVVRAEFGKPPEIHVLKIPPNLVQSVYPEPLATRD